LADGREQLKLNPYPGRGIILSLDATGRYAIQVYWITARSAGSKNRILVIQGDDVRTQPFDEAERSDDPNIWYRAIARAGDRHVVSNGVQTDTIVDHLASDRSFEDAVGTTSYETDAPNFTPRIAAMTDLSSSRPEIAFGMASRAPDSTTIHNLYNYQAEPAMGYCFHTYAGDGNPVPAYAGRPYEIDLPGTPDDIASDVWRLLPVEKRVALAIKVIDVETKQVVSLTVQNALS
jgi:IMP cyclohydrolase